MPNAHVMQCSVPTVSNGPHPTESRALCVVQVRKRDSQEEAAKPSVTRRVVDRQSWDKEEDEVILRGVAAVGKSWRAIATLLPRGADGKLRSDSSVRNRWHRLVDQQTAGEQNLLCEPEESQSINPPIELEEETVQVVAPQPSVSLFAPLAPPSAPLAPRSPLVPPSASLGMPPQDAPLPDLPQLIHSAASAKEITEVGEVVEAGEIR